MHPRTPKSIGALLRGDNLRMTGKLVVVAGLMFGFGYALVPLYKAICDALGINVLAVSERGGPVSKQRPDNTQVDASRTVTVEFDANARGPWDFKPALRSVQVHPGEVATVMYEFRNKQNRTMAAQATNTRSSPARAGSGRWCSTSMPSCRKT
jgi:cytochrome c oxidase assembly protein subunit 11